MAARPPTIIDVAARAGVSKSLVSMVMRGDPGVSPARRAAVLAAAAALGYRVNRAAAILAGTRTGTVGVVVDDFRNPWYVPMLDGIRQVLAPRGLRLTLADGAANAHLGASPFDDLVSLRVDGVVLAAESPAGLVVPDGLPVVVAGERAVRPADTDTVASDEAAGGRLAVHHLVELGHRRIAHLTGTGGSATARRVAAVAEMARSGITPVVAGDDGTDEAAGHQAARAVLAHHPGVTALFAANDVMAMGAMAAVLEAGLRVPQDVSVIGHDETPLASSPLVRLTTVDPHNDEVGRRAAARLLERLDAAGGGAAAGVDRGAAAGVDAGAAAGVDGGAAAALTPVRSLVEPTLVLRGTTAPPPS